MSRINTIVWGLMAAFGAFIVHESLDHNYYGSDFGPGPGFFSFWLGIILMVLSIIQIIMIYRRTAEPLPDSFIPDRNGIKRMLFVVGALAASLILMNILGYCLTILVFCLFLLRKLGQRQSWWLTLTLAIVGSFGTFYLFKLLQVNLPKGFLGIV